MAERLSSGDEFESRVRVFVEAQQRMEDEGCPNVVSPQDTIRIAEELAAVTDRTPRFSPVIGSGRFGRGVLGGPISAANRLDAQRAEGTGPRQPEVRGNGKA